jgi:hypothetical protein
MKRALRRIALGLAAAVVAVGALDAPARAAASSLVDNGDGSITVTLGTGDSLWICSTATLAVDCNLMIHDYTANSSGVYSAGVMIQGRFRVEPLPAGTYNISTGPSTGARSSTLTNVTILELPTSSASESGLPFIIQQVGLPASGCSAVNRPDLNWANVSGAGWAPTWSLWLNDGRGGAVCSRILEFSTSEARWVLRIES